MGLSAPAARAGSPEALEPRRELPPQLDVVAHAKRLGGEVDRLVEIAVARRQPARQRGARLARRGRIAAGARLLDARPHPGLLGAVAAAPLERLRRDRRAVTGRPAAPSTPAAAAFRASIAALDVGAGGRRLAARAAIGRDHPRAIVRQVSARLHGCRA